MNDYYDSWRIMEELYIESKSRAINFYSPADSTAGRYTINKSRSQLTFSAMLYKNYGGNFMKKIILLIPLCVAMLAFSSCGSENNTAENTVSESPASVSENNADISENDEEITQNETSAAADKNAIEQPEEVPEAAPSKSIVVYFSCTGNTKAVAEIIAEKQGAYIYEIIPEQPYTDEDLDYGNRASRSTSEQNDSSSRPAISGSIDLIGYDTIYVGYPIWWADMPKIMYTFFDAYDLSGKIIAPFCTSGGSGLSGTPKTIAGLEPDATVTAGLHVSSYSPDNADTDVADWLAEIGLSE